MPRKETTLDQQLRDGLCGEVHSDLVTRGIYATDASIFQQLPAAVVMPRDVAEVRHVLQVARDNGLAVLPRGAGTSLAGQAVCDGIVVDLSKYMNRVLKIDVTERTVRVQPGVVRDQLNAKLAELGLQFSPETATSNRACIGGMIGNNSAGMRSLLYGQTIDHILELEVILATGEALTLKRMPREAWQKRCRQPDHEGAIYKGVADVIETHHDEIIATYPSRVRRSVGGYRLDRFCREDQPWSLCDLVVGSEGTLCTVVEAKLKLEPLPRAQSLCVVHFASMRDALGAVEAIVAREPSAVELLDHTVIEGARNTFGGRWSYSWLEGEPAAVLLVEFCGDSDAAVWESQRELIRQLRSERIGYAHRLAVGAEQAEVWEVRKAGLGLLAAVKGEAKPTAFIEDAAVPLPALPQYIDGMLAACASLDVKLSMYAHASVGLLHLRPLLDLKSAGDIERMKQLAERSLELVTAHGGTISGEHGDGRVRSWLLPRLYSPRICHAFREVKQLFDPEARMNPGVIVDPAPMDAGLRYGTSYRTDDVSTYYRYPDDGSLAAAAELCTGVGACRKVGAGNMCPSYMATRDETDSTRGRANALRLAISGQLGSDGIASEELEQVFALCLSCKACKSECPSNVDVARLKSEFLAARRDHHGEKIADRLVAGSTATAAAVAGPLAPLVNWLGNNKLLRAVSEPIVGLDRRRPLPAFARRSFASWFDRYRQQRRTSNGPPVALFLDTYLNYHEPAVGQAAVIALEALGFVPEALSAGCCCRPQISKGYLPEAREVGGQTLANIAAVLDRGTPVVVCEPGCYSALVDDLPDLIDDVRLGQRIQRDDDARIWLIDQFLFHALAQRDTRALEQQGQQRAARAELRYLLHGHCHQKALVGTDAMTSLLRRFSGRDVEDIDAGCCGMAGAFGYDPKHYELSKQIGEQRLFPAIRARPKGTNVVACGFSCRHQISDMLSVTARHFIEELAALIG